jgi:nucleotide-binding universal stress UspA family protein
MSGGMKILIGYDGSECSDAALEDLRRAGLPQEAEARVLTVADVILPPPIDEERDNTFPFYVPAGVRRAHERAERAVADAGRLAARARDRVKAAFPRWDVRAEAYADSPAWALVKEADSWRPDLVVVGAHGHASLGGRLVLGSVSQRVLYEARCSVRVARDVKEKPEGSPVRLLVGADGSPGSEAAVAAVAAREWPAGSEARVVTVLDTMMFVTDESGESAVARWAEAEDEADRESAEKFFEPSLARLRGAGLGATLEVRAGNPKRVLVEEAESWGADCVFVGAKGLRGVDRLLLGSVSSAVVAGAHCSVEVVRQKPAERA